MKNLKLSIGFLAFTSFHLGTLNASQGSVSKAMGRCLHQLNTNASSVANLLPFRSTTWMNAADLFRAIRGSTNFRVDEIGDSRVAELDNLIHTGDIKGAIGLIRSTMARVEISFRKLKPTDEARKAFGVLRDELKAMKGEIVKVEEDGLEYEVETLPADANRRVSEAIGKVVKKLRPDHTYLLRDQDAITNLRQMSDDLNDPNFPVAKDELIAQVDATYKWLDSLYTVLKSEIGENISSYIPVVAYLNSSEYHRRSEVIIDGIAFAPAASDAPTRQMAVLGGFELAMAMPEGPDLGPDVGRSAAVPSDAEAKWREGVEQVRKNVGMTEAYHILNPDLDKGPPPLRDILYQVHNSPEIQKNYTADVLYRETLAVGFQIAWDSLVLLPELMKRSLIVVPALAKKDWNAASSILFEGFRRMRIEAYLTDVKNFVDDSLHQKAKLPKKPEVDPAKEPEVDTESVEYRRWMYTRIRYISDRIGNNRYGSAYLECFARDTNEQVRSFLREVYNFEKNSSEKLFQGILSPIEKALVAGDKFLPISVGNSRLRPTYYIALAIDLVLVTMWLTGNDDHEEARKKVAELLNEIKSGDVPNEVLQPLVEEAKALEAASPAPAAAPVMP